MADKRGRKRKPYTLKQVLLIGTHALMECENILLDSESDADRIRAANAISGLLNSYARCCEGASFEARLSELENSIHES